MKMNKIIVGLLFAAVNLSANVTGENVYNAKCAKCHMLETPMNMDKVERMETMQEMMMSMKAPSMAMVSAKVKHAVDNDEAAFTAFVMDYIKSPSRDKAVCMPMAIKRFGLMPPIGASMSMEERSAVAVWLYKNFNEKWDDKKCMPWKSGMGMEGKGMMQDQNSMRCAAGKCGMGKNSSY
jgi:cytochrome c5